MTVVIEKSAFEFIIIINQMQTTFTAACFAAVAVAAPSPSKLNNSPAFIDFMAKNNKQYVSTK